MEEPTAFEPKMSMANVVFRWLGYDLWNDQTPEEADVQESESNWVWVAKDGDILSQDDLEFFERKQQKIEPLLSYADAVRASIDRCKNDEASSKKDDDYNILLKKIANCNLAEEKEIIQNADVCLNEELQMKMRTSRKRTSLARYQPFPKNQKASFLERENMTSYLLDRQILPYNSGRITLLNLTEPSAANGSAKYSNDSHWITVGKENSSFKPVSYPRVAKMRFVVDVSDNNCINILRMGGNTPDLSRSQNLKDICTIVDDIKPPEICRYQRKDTRNIQILSAYNESGMGNRCIVNISKRPTKMTERKRGRKALNTSRKPLNINTFDKKRCIQLAIERNIIPLQHLLGIKHQPMSVEWQKKGITKDLPQSILHGFKFMGDVFNGILNIALSLSPTDVAEVQRPYNYDNSAKMQESVAVRRKKAPSKRFPMQKNLRSKKDSKAQLNGKTNSGACKWNKKKRYEFVNANKAPKNYQRGNNKNRNFIPQKFSGRGGARGR